VLLNFGKYVDLLLKECADLLDFPLVFFSPRNSVVTKLRANVIRGFILGVQPSVNMQHDVQLQL